MAYDKAYQREYYLKNRERRIENVRRWAAANPDKALFNKAAQKRRRLRLRAEMIEAYGGECECCGEMAAEFMTIDHLRGNGQAHRGSIGGGGTHFLAVLKQQGWPKDGLRLLCMNCNWATRFGRTCPHKLTKC